MSARGIVAMGVATLLLMVAAILLNWPESGDLERTNEPLVPGLSDRINDIEEITVTAAGEQRIATLERARDRWVVAEKHGFEADFEQVHDLLRSLSAARRIEARTDNPEWYGRLGVRDVSETDAEGVAIAFPDTGLDSVIIGLPDRAGRGRFVRLDGQQQTWLTDRVLEIPTRTIEWLQRSVMDIPASELAEVTLRHPSGETLVLRPADDDGEEWVLLDVPEDREARPMWELAPVANALANVQLTDVRSHERVPEDAVRGLFVTRDGLNFLASTWTEDDAHWVHFTVNAEVTAAAGDEGLDESAASLAADAAAVDARLSAWDYRIDERKYQTLTRDLESLLQPVEEREQ